MLGYVVYFKPLVCLNITTNNQQKL